jgi:branched-chain amino acid transport system substrate-binding protein
MLVRLISAISVISAFLLFAGQPAAAQVSDDVVKIGVLSDLSGVNSDASGTGAMLAAKMAAEDFGGTVLGKPITVVNADIQMKPDVAAATAGRWFSSEGVDVIADLPVSSAALAVQEVARKAGKTLLISGAATSEITGKSCAPYTSHWADDTYVLAKGLGRGLVSSGSKTWFFIAADYALGASIQRDATATIEGLGGKVIGGVRHPVNTADFASYLLQAQASKADVIGLANVGQDLTNVIKQAGEFGIIEKQKLAGFLVFITDVDSLGLKLTHGTNVVEDFYWDQNDAARAWSKRYFAQEKRMPTKEQAGVYAAVTHYLKAVKAAGTDEAAAVNRKMKELPVDFFGRQGTIRKDGRVMVDVTLYEVKSPGEVKYPWDYYKPIQTLPASEVNRPIETGGCPLVNN